MFTKTKVWECTLRREIDTINDILTNYPFHEIELEEYSFPLKVEGKNCYYLIEREDCKFDKLTKIQLKNIDGDGIIPNLINNALKGIRYMKFDHINNYKFVSFDSSILVEMSKNAGEVIQIIIEIDVPDKCEINYIYKPKGSVVSSNIDELEVAINDAIYEAFRTKYHISKEKIGYEIEDFKNIRNYLFKEYINHLSPIPLDVFREWKYNMKLFSNEDTKIVYVELF